jgi:signal transduction histidine kinase/DNA-binding NarL/FixJ family response regulator
VTTQTAGNSSSTLAPSMPRRGSWPKWLYLYFILAGCLVLVLWASLYFNHRIVGLQTKSVQFNRAWATRSQRYGELGRLAAEVNLPGNDVFESGDPVAEAANLQAALQSFHRAATAARDDLNANVAAQDAVPLLQDLELVGVNVEKMAKEAELVFEYFGKDSDKAGERMAAMDRQCKEVRNAIYALERQVSDIQERSFDEQEKEATALTNWEYGLVGLIVLLVGGVVAYAVMLSRQIADAARVDERNLALLQASEEALRNQTLAAERANSAKSTFLANMSHEIRTPMTAIMGYSEMLLESDPEGTERKEAVQAIHRSARHLLVIINDVLDISKIEADKMTVERIATNVPQIAADVVSLMRPSAIAKGVGCQLTFGDSVARTIRSDPVRVKQVLMNLVGNALKFTERGEIRLHVSSIVKDEANIAVFEVTDSGIGMSNDQVRRIFEPFTQADDSTTRRFGGTGLGLTISKRLAEMLGGELSVDSLPGVGSKFRFTIDGGSLEGVEMLHGFTESLVAVSPELAECKPATLRGRVLLAEDGPDNQRLISMHLRKAGAEVVVAENGRIAVDLARSEPFDVILMDMQMPELDGYAATTELRSHGCELPIIALTAHAMAEDRDKCLAAGCSDYLTKPIEKKTLLLALAKYLGGSVLDEAEPLPRQRSWSSAPDGVLKSSFADDPDMQEAIEEFVATLPTRTAALEQLLHEQDFLELRRAVHQLKGAGGGYGYDKITQLATDVECAMERKDPLEAIEAEVNALIAVIRSVEGYQPAGEAIHA